MKLKYLILSVAMYFAATANAAVTKCEYQDQPCDQFGNHYLCTVSGWVGPSNPQYCAPDDRSTRKAIMDFDGTDFGTATGDEYN